MITLADVQSDVQQQLERDYAHLTIEKCAEMCRYGLMGETGEIMEIFKGRIRCFLKDSARCTDKDLKSELGDVLWYLTALCSLHDTSLEEIYLMNCEKLNGRGWR